MSFPLRHLHLTGAAGALIALALVGKSSPPANAHHDPIPVGALLRLGTVRLRHPNRLMALAYSPDGKVLAVADGESGASYRGQGFLDGSEGGIRLWDATTGKELRRLAGHEGVIRFLTFSADGRCLMSAGDDGRARLWDPATGKEMGSFGGPGTLRCAGLSADGKTIAVGEREIIRLIDVKSKNEVRRITLPTEASVYNLAFSADGKTLAGTRNQKNETTVVCLWDVATGSELHNFPGEWAGPNFREWAGPSPFSPDGKLLVTVASHLPIRIRDVKTGKVVRTIADTSNPAFSVTFSQDGKVLLGIRYDGAVLWDAQTGKELRRFGRDEMESYDAGVLSPDGKTLALCDVRAVRLFDVATGKELLGPPAHGNEVVAVAFSPDGKTALTAGDRLFLWDAKSGKQLAAPGPVATVRAAAFTPDGRSVVAGYFNESRISDEVIRVFEVSTGKELHCFYDERDAVQFAGFLADGKSLISIGRSCRRLCVWDMATGEQVRQIGDEIMMNRVAVSADRRLVATGMDHIQLWDAASGRERAKLDRLRGGLFALALTPDARRLLYSSYEAENDTPIHVWDVASGKEMGRLAARDHIALCLAVSPDGRIVASGGSDNTVRLWDLATGKELRKLTGHQGPVLCLAFSPDGRRLISGSRDTTALIWDVADVLPAEPTVHLEAAELNDLWTALASPDGAAALKAVRRLVRAPEQSLAKARTQLGKQPAADADRLARLIADLNADDFDKRESASAELARLGRLAEPALKRALADKPSAELRKRATALLKKLDEQKVSSDDLQALRAVEVLESIGTPEAAKLIESLAKTSPSPRVAEEAKAAGTRMRKKRAGHSAP